MWFCNFLFKAKINIIDFAESLVTFYTMTGRLMVGWWVVLVAWLDFSLFNYAPSSTPLTVSTTKVNKLQVDCLNNRKK